MTPEEELTIFTNILAQSPDGLGDPQLIGKFAKAKAQIHARNSMAAMQSQMMPPPPAQPLAGGTISPVVGNSPVEPQIMSNQTPNTPPGV